METELDLQDEANAIAAADAEAQPPATLLTQNQRKRFQAFATGGQKLLSERMAATRDLLERAPDDGYAIELFVTDNPEPARMERFLIRARDMVPLSDVFLIPMGGSGSQRMRVIYGSFESAKDAQQAERRLPPKYQQAFRTAPRSFAELRKQM